MKIMNDAEIHAIAQKAAALIVDEALATGFKYRPGHHRSTSGAVLEMHIEAVIRAWAELHLRPVGMVSRRGESAKRATSSHL